MGVMEAVFLKYANTEEEALENMEECFNLLFAEDCLPADKPIYFETCRSLYREWECIRDEYVCHPRQRYYKDKLRKKKKTYDHVKHECGYRCGNSDQLNTSEHFCGLYFIHQIGEINGELYCAVKVGQSDDIGKRMGTYKSHNPFAKHSMETLETTCCRADRWQMEYNCNQFLNQFARQDVKADGEWTIVNSEDYDMLCEMFSNEDVFSIIANGGE